jgi:hypothetical protein
MAAVTFALGGHGGQHTGAVETVAESAVRSKAGLWIDARLGIDVLVVGKLCPGGNRAQQQDDQ